MVPRRRGVWKGNKIRVVVGLPTRVCDGVVAYFGSGGIYLYLVWFFGRNLVFGIWNIALLLKNSVHVEGLRLVLRGLRCYIYSKVKPYVFGLILCVDLDFGIDLRSPDDQEEGSVFFIYFCVDFVFHFCIRSI